MKTTLTLFAILFLNGIVAIAQPCTTEELLKQPGHWTPGMGGSTSGISTADLARQKAVVNKIIDPIKNQYTPKGIDILYGGAYMGQSNLPQHINGGNYYYAYFYFLDHDCPYDKAKMASKHFDGSLTVYANDFGLFFGQTFFVPEQPYEENLYADGFALIDQPPVKTDKGWHWKDGDGTNATIDHRYVITKGDKTPFIHITKKEYANMAKAFCEKKIRAAETEYNRSLKSGEETYVQMKTFSEADAKTVRDQNKINAARYKEMEIEHYTPFLRVIDDFLKTTSENALQEPAIIDHVKGTNGFFGFVDANHQNAKWAIKPNPEYFDKSLSASTPQFFTVHFNIYEIEGLNPLRIAMEDLMKTLDFNALKSMIGK